MCEKQVEIDGRMSMMNILDMDGQAEYNEMREQHMRTGEGFLLVYSIPSRESFDQIRIIYDQIQQVKQAHPQYEFGGMPAILIVGNKCDRPGYEWEVSDKEGRDFATRLGVPFMLTSALTGYNVDDAFCGLAMEVNLSEEKRRMMMEAFDQARDDPTVV
jgi:GTPase KRas protein